ncbi:MAG: TetR/AcrR family transcriptional regulator [Chloroflexota bacterium]
MDRRIRRTRKMLCDALIRLVMEKPYETITIQEITDEADLNRATFYLHFGSREELLATSLTTYYDDLTQRISAITEDVPIWASTQAIQMVFEHVQDNAALYRVLIGNPGLGMVINQIIDYTAVYTQHGVEQLCDSSKMTVPLPIVMYHFAGSLYATLSWWIQNDMPYTPEEMAVMGKELCLNGTIDLFENSLAENVSLAVSKVN